MQRDVDNEPYLTLQEFHAHLLTRFFYSLTNRRVTSECTFGDMNHCPVNFCSMTDGQTDGRKVPHMSPLCNMQRWTQNLQAPGQQSWPECIAIIALNLLHNYQFVHRKINFRRYDNYASKCVMCQNTFAS